MAKSQNRQVDKVERKARLANARRHQELEQRDMQNMNRMGWRDIGPDFDDDLEQDDQWPSAG